MKYYKDGSLEHCYTYRTNPTIETVERWCDLYDEDSGNSFKLKKINDEATDTECVLFGYWIHIKDIKTYNLIKNGIIGKDFPLLKKLLMLK